jgi:PEGA domain
VLCRAEKSCQKPVLPGEYKVIAERPGFQRWTTRVTVDKGTTAKVAIALVEQRSPLTVRVVPSGARVTVDGAAYDASAPTSVAPGAHRVEVTLAGHKAVRRELIAREGKPIDLEVALPLLVPIRVAPPSAELFLDGQPIAVEDGRVAIPAGAHVLAARAKGFHGDTVAIPAARGASYQLAVELQRASRLTPRRKLALVAGGAGLVSIGAGAVLGLEKGQFRTPPSQLGYGLGGWAVAVAIGLWLEGKPRARPSQRIAVTPYVGSARGDSVAGLGLAVGF